MFLATTHCLDHRSLPQRSEHSNTEGSKLETRASSRNERAAMDEVEPVAAQLQREQEKVSPCVRQRAGQPVCQGVPGYCFERRAPALALPSTVGCRRCTRAVVSAAAADARLANPPRGVNKAPTACTQVDAFIAEVGEEMFAQSIVGQVGADVLSVVVAGCWRVRFARQRIRTHGHVCAVCSCMWCLLSAVPTLHKAARRWGLSPCDFACTVRSRTPVHPAGSFRTGVVPCGQTCHLLTLILLSVCGVPWLCLCMCVVFICCVCMWCVRVCRGSCAIFGCCAS